MEDFNFDKKTENERLASAAIDSGDYAAAARYLEEAARHSIILAKRCSGELARAYVANASRILDSVEALRKRETAKAGLKNARSESVDGESGDEDKDGANRAVNRADLEEVRFDDIVGLEDPKRLIREELVYPSRYPHIYEQLKVKPSKGVVLYGPPGTGKTTFAKAVAFELDCEFINVDCTELVSKYVGDTGKNIKRLFEEADKYERCVMFFDECDRLMARKGNEKVKSVDTLKEMLDGMRAKSGNRRFILCGTNYPWKLDGALVRPGRLSRMIYVGLPSREERLDCLRKLAVGYQLAPDVDLEGLTDTTDGYSYAELASSGGIFQVAVKNGPLRRWREKCEAKGKESAEWNQAEPLTKADFDAALQVVTPGFKVPNTAKLIRDNEAFRDGRFVSGSNDPDGAD